MSASPPSPSAPITSRTGFWSGVALGICLGFAGGVVVASAGCPPVPVPASAPVAQQPPVVVVPAAAPAPGVTSIDAPVSK